MVPEAGLRLPVSLLNNWQRRYAIRLLAAPITQLTRGILLVTLCQGDEEA